MYNPTTSPPSEYGQTKLLLGITGGIAAYKSADLVRRLKEKNFDVQVAITQSASHFITKTTLQAVSGNTVHQQMFKPSSDSAMDHIDLAKWADIILIAPATANIIAKIASGIADDLLTTTLLASAAKLVIAPAMNQQMWSNPATQSNIQRLKERDITFWGPAEGEQACGDTGFGRMLEPEDLAKRADLLVKKTALKKKATQNHFKDSPLKGKRVVITAGPTIEPIDPVRFISNHSSGKMGYALAKAARDVGANVYLISGPVALDSPIGIETIRVTSANEMLKQVQRFTPNCELFIGCAAVADYTPEVIANQKIKKRQPTMALSLIKNPDIISWVTATEPRPFVVGFAAESENLKENAKSKLMQKNMDLICANDISQSETGFNSNNNEILILDNNHRELHVNTASKDEIARAIVGEIEKSLAEKASTDKTRRSENISEN